ncbi:NAD(P)H-dependent flavin oxidoreductase YrpB (nitropropane dioxygenase family) [Pseudonocardia sediminis]|uniref:NAD(P)H-dependent flavin oxidoreductase YrpB (Nitropropane dioxygenase family) n=1 Tax=Pseudonocardia sediminis TaxID=1397368 RepID=A0A4Q7V3E9_PSEST|nr:nitronate monooxygenase [Pseudonocardia sediminis]RZT87203.1 NAD(P)H-dependent flavin oxidoreductase YrpB (nitropropane dioxygenase family) [Pseudonocardia sediminis]
MRTALTDLLGIDAPLVGFNRSPGVVAEVSRAGGLGVLAATMYSPEELDAQLTWIEERLDGRPYGVDLLVPGHTAPADPADLLASLQSQIPPGHVRFVEELLERYDIPKPSTPREQNPEILANLDPSGVPALLDVVFAHPIALVANALGAPPPTLVDRAKDAGVVVASLVGKPEHAARQLDAGVDVLVAQGTEAGGHTGTIATTVLTPEIVERAGGRPVLAAGGIATGAQMAAALALGASGVWCGSVWLSSHEDITPEPVKRKFLAASSSDTLRSRTRTGKPARQLRSAWHDEWEGEGSPGALPMPLQPLLTAEAWSRIDDAAEAGHTGATALESYYIGQVVGGFTALRPAAEITREIVDDCTARLRELAGLVGDPSRTRPQTVE